nr:hypothetical protein [Providencia alcalifaciens]
MRQKESNEALGHRWLTMFNVWSDREMPISDTGWHFSLGCNTDMAAICGAACFMTGWALYVDGGVSVSK